MREEELFGSVVGGRFHSAVRSVAPLWWHALLSLSMVVLMSIISVVGMIPLGGAGSRPSVLNSECDGCLRA